MAKHNLWKDVYFKCLIAAGEGKAYKKKYELWSFVQFEQGCHV